MNWPPELKTFVSSAWSEGLSASQIVRALWDKHRVTKSRSAVIGIVRRLALHRPKPTRAVEKVRRLAQPNTVRLSASGTKGGLKSGIIRAAKASKAPLKPVASLQACDGLVKVVDSIREAGQAARMSAEALANVSQAALSARGVSIMALQAGMCRFIIDDRGGEALYCGLPVEGRKASYCEGCRTGDLNRGRNGHKKPLVADPARAVTVSDSVAGYARIGSGRLPAKASGGLFNDWA